MQVAAHVPQRDGLSVGHDFERDVQACLGEVSAGRGFAEAVDRAGGQSEPQTSIMDRRTEAGGPRPGRQPLDGFDELTRCHQVAGPGPEQVARLAQQVGGRGHRREFAGQRLEGDVFNGNVLFAEKGGIEAAVNIGNAAFYEIIVELKD